MISTYLPPGGSGRSPCCCVGYHETSVAPGPRRLLCLTACAWSRPPTSLSGWSSTHLGRGRRREKEGGGREGEGEEEGGGRGRKEGGGREKEGGGEGERGGGELEPKLFLTRYCPLEPSLGMRLARHPPLTCVTVGVSPGRLPDDGGGWNGGSDDRNGTLGVSGDGGVGCVWVNGSDRRHFVGLDG